MGKSSYRIREAFYGTGSLDLYPNFIDPDPTYATAIVNEVNFLQTPTSKSELKSISNQREKNMRTYDFVLLKFITLQCKNKRYQNRVSDISLMFTIL
jgi:hypothetical protein